MDLRDLWQALSATGLGLLIGLEREHARREQGVHSGPEPHQAQPSPGELHQKGARTFALIGLYGYALCLCGERFAALPVVGLLGLAGLLSALHLIRPVPNNGPGSGDDVTTEIAALATAVLGILCRINQGTAAILGLTLAAILISKPYVKGLVPKLRRGELIGTLQLLIAVLIVVPLAPSSPLPLPGPLKTAIVPRSVLLFVVLTAGVSYAGYVLTRALGPKRGLGVTGLVGGLVSSTAVTMAMGERAKVAPALSGIASLSALLACLVMSARVIGLSFVVYPPLGWRVLTPGIAMALGYLLAGAVLLLRARRQGPKDTEPTPDHPVLALDNPFELGPALKFGAIYVAVLIAAKLLHGYMGQ